MGCTTPGFGAVRAICPRCCTPLDKGEANGPSGWTRLLQAPGRVQGHRSGSRFGVRTKRPSRPKARPVRAKRFVVIAHAGAPIRGPVGGSVPGVFSQRRARAVHHVRMAVAVGALPPRDRGRLSGRGGALDLAYLAMIGGFDVGGRRGGGHGHLAIHAALGPGVRAGGQPLADQRRDPVPTAAAKYLHDLHVRFGLCGVQRRVRFGADLIKRYNTNDSGPAPSRVRAARGANRHAFGYTDVTPEAPLAYDINVPGGVSLKQAKAPPMMSKTRGRTPPDKKSYPVRLPWRVRPATANRDRMTLQFENWKW